MANQYSRRQKTTTKSAKKTGKNPKEHIKTGLTALQKTIAITASTLGIITALITIYNFNSNSKSKDSGTSTKTTIIKEVDSNNSASTDAAANQDQNASNNSNNQAATTIASDDSSASDSNAGQSDVVTQAAEATTQAAN